MDRIKTIVVDDEPLALDLVADYVEQAPYLEIVGRCTNARDAYERIGKGDVQLVFCDIQMPGMSGLTLMKSIEEGNRPKVIFTTAFPEYALDGFRLDAIDYLLKPFDSDEFLKAANKARRLIELEHNAKQIAEKDEEGNYFFVKSEYKLVRIDKAKIIYIEGLKDYIRIHLDDGVKPIMTLYSLKEMMTTLDEPCFVRLHRSFIINTKYIKGAEKGYVVMKGDEKVPIGEQYKSQINEIINSKTV